MYFNEGVGLSGTAGDVSTMFFGTVSGGLSAELSGGNFWQGAATGVVVSGLNHVMHRIGNEQIFSEDENGDPTKPRPDASKIDEKYGVGNKTWEKKEGRWTITTKKEILQWDSKKGEIEIYNRGQKEHLGGYDPYNRGKQISPAKSSRVPNGGWKSNYFQNKVFCREDYKTRRKAV